MFHWHYIQTCHHVTHNDRGPFQLEFQRTSLLPYSSPVQMKGEVLPEQGMFLLNLFYESRSRMQPFACWQIDHLRGYGASNSILKIKTGRWCEGAGLLVCASHVVSCSLYPPQEKLYRRRDFCVTDSSGRDHSPCHPPLGQDHNDQVQTEPDLLCL